MALFTCNCYFCLPAPTSPESDSSDDEDGPTRLPIFTARSTNPIVMPGKASPNVSPLSCVSDPTTIILLESDPGNPSCAESPKKDDPSKAILPADNPSNATVTIPTVASSSSPMEQSTVAITNQAAPTPVQTTATTGLITQSTPVSANLAVLSYGDVKSNLPSIGSLIGQPRVTDSTMVTSTIASVRSDFNKTLLTLAQEASKMYALSGDGVPINARFSTVDGQNIVTTTTYSLGGNNIGNLSPQGQHLNWVCQSTKEALETARSQPYPSARGRGRLTHKCSSSRKQAEKPNTPPTSDE